MNWHERYLHQASWTRDLRKYVFAKCGWDRARCVLEVGCGTGAILQDPIGDPSEGPHPQLYGLDIQAAALGECQRNAPSAFLTRGDALEMPFAPGKFNITYCHFLLLWLHEPVRGLLEMKRVTATSGYVMALAEPDYTARVDEPAELAWLGRKQNEALERQGAAIGRGGELADLFWQAGIHVRESGTLQPAMRQRITEEDWQSEWAVLEADLAGTLDWDRLQSLRESDRKAWLQGQRLLRVPTYFAWGQV
jgi:SAM-dependent methyltransferase